MALTDMQIKKLVPRKERYEIADGGGLSIRVLPTGAKSWVYRYLFEGNPRRMTLGTYPVVTLAEARKKHGDAVLNLKHGIDPGLAQKNSKAKRKAAPIFKELLEEFWEIELRTTASGAERKRLIEKDALPSWGSRKLADITRRDAVLLIDKVRERAPIVANRLQSILVRMFNFAAERGVLDISPLNGMRKKSEKARDRVLTGDEIRMLWAALDLENKEIDIYRQTKLALKMILLTGQRPGEVAGMPWDEIDEGSRLWIIPAIRMKNRIEQVVPLTQTALEVLEEARHLGKSTNFVFGSSYVKGEAMTAHAMSRAVVRHSLAIGIIERWTPHDLRRTVRTGLAALGVDDVAAERVLGHKLQGVMGVYNRHSYLKEKRAALESWDTRLRQIVCLGDPEIAKVIPLERKAA